MQWTLIVLFMPKHNCVYWFSKHQSCWMELWENKQIVATIWNMPFENSANEAQEDDAFVSVKKLFSETGFHLLIWIAVREDVFVEEWRRANINRICIVHLRWLCERRLVSADAWATLLLYPCLEIATADTTFAAATLISFLLLNCRDNTFVYKLSNSWCVN